MQRYIFRYFNLVVPALVVVTLFGAAITYYPSGEKPLADLDEPQTVPSASSDAAIHLDVAQGVSGTIHLIWQSEAGVRYQRSTNFGETWTDPSELALAADSRFGNGPRIFYRNGDLVAFWWDGGLKTRTSTDGGRTWPEEHRSLFQDISILLGEYSLMAEGDTIYLAFFSPEGLFFARSEDFGQSWSQFIKVSSDVETYISDPPDLAASGEDVYLLWTLDEKLFWARSTYSGKTWDKSTPINTDRSRFGEIYGGGNYSISQPTIAASEAGISAFYRERGVFHHWKPKEKKQWSPTTQISSHSAFQLTACSKGNRSFAGWADTRYRKRSWWDIIPGAQLFGDPFWANSDLFVRSVEGDTVGELLRLTSPLSFVSSQSEPSLSCSREGLFAFWSGRKKVGKTVDAYGHSTQIFFHKLTP